MIKPAPFPQTFIEPSLLYHTTTNPPRYDYELLPKFQQNNLTLIIIKPETGSDQLDMTLTIMCAIIMNNQ